MADMRKATLSVTVAADAALKNLQSIKTQFQSLDKLGTKSLTSSLNTSVKAVKDLSTQLKGSGAREFAGDIADAQDQVKDLGYTGIQSGGLITNAIKKAADGVGGLVGKMGGIKGALAGLGVTAVLGGMVYSAASAQIDKQGALTVAKQRGWHEKEISELETFMNKRNDYVSKADVYLFAQRAASYEDDTEGIAASLDAETKLFANNMGRLRDKGINSVMDLDAAIKAGDQTALQGILNINFSDLTSEVVEKARLAADRETGGPQAAGWEEALKKYEVYYKYQEVMADATKDMTIDSSSAAASMMKFNKTLSDLQTTLGEQLLPTIIAMMEWMNNLVKAMGPGLTTLAAVGAGIIGVIAVVAMIAPGLAMLAAPLKLIFGILGGATPLGLLITGLIVVVPLLYAWADKMGYVKKAADWLNKLDLGTKFTNTLKFIWEGILNVGIILDAIYDLFKRFVGWVLGGINNIIKWIIDIPNKLGTIFDAIKTTLEGLPAKIKEAIGMGEDKKLTDDQKTLARDQAQVMLESSDIGLDRNQIHKLIDPLDKYLTRTTKEGEVQYKWAGDQAEKAWMSEGWKDVTDSLIIPIEKYDEATSMIAAARASGEVEYSVPIREPESNRENLSQWSLNPRQDAVGAALNRGDYTEAVHNANPMADAIEYLPSALGYAKEGFMNFIGMDTGGRVNADGLVKVHAGERILSEGDVQRGNGGSGGNVTVHMTINNPMFTDSASMHKFDQHVRDLINRENLVHMTNKRGRGAIV